MSILIDHLIEARTTQVQIHGVWCIAKPGELSKGRVLSLTNRIGFSMRATIVLNRIKDCLRVLTGKSVAVHYTEDDCKERCE